MTTLQKITGLTMIVIVMVITIPYVASGDGTPDCDPGYYLSGVICLPCGEGRYSTGGTVTECLPCEPGTYQPEEGSESCMLCPPNTFSAVTQSTSCAPCPSGYRSQEGAFMCTQTTVGKRSSISKESFITPSSTDTAEENENQEGGLLETTNSDALTKKTEDTKPYTLTSEETTRVTGIAQRIILLIQASDDPQAMYETTIQLLQDRLEMYTNNNDQKKIALVTKLIEILQDTFE